MDIESNKREQIELAETIMETWDKCPESGEFTWLQLDTLANAAYRIAELIQASHEYNFNRNQPA